MISPGAQIAPDVTIGPYSVVEDSVVIGPGTQIGPHCVIHPFVRLGSGNRLHAQVVLGGLPQDTSFAGGETWIEIGDENIFRENFPIYAIIRNHVDLCRS